MKTWRSVSSYLENILIAIFLALIMKTFVVSTYKVPTTSMVPALVPGDFILSYHLPYGLVIPLTSEKLFLSTPKRWEVVVFRYPDQPQTNFVKRVVALPGEKVEIRAGRLWINDQQISYEPAEGKGIEEFQGEAQVYLEDGHHLILSRAHLDGQDDFGPIVVPPGEVFVLGDHRDVSDDSRYWGSIPVQNLDGRVVAIWLSVNWTQRNFLGLPALRRERLFHSIN